MSTSGHTVHMWRMVEREEEEELQLKILGVFYVAK